jgi:hypothetical protein
MHKVMVATLLGVLAVGCDAQDEIPIRTLLKDSGTPTGSGGSGGGSSTTGGMSGSAMTTGTGGSVGAGGSNGQAGTAGTGGGSGGGSMPDASSDATNAADSSSADMGVDTGMGYPEASTCAGYAVVFNGFAYGTINTRPVQDDFTLEAWIKTTDARTGATPDFFLGSGLIYADVPGVANDFGTSILNNKFAFGVGNPDTTILSTTSVNTGQWVHVAATRKMSTGEIQVFVNGTMEISKVVAQTASLTASASMSLGANVVDNRYFTGTMDEVRIWSTVRTQVEISSNMHKRMTGSEAGLVGYYRFDQPGADTATDLSSKMGDASLVGPDWAPSDAPICN